MHGAGRHPGPLQDKLLAIFDQAKLPTSPAIARKILKLIDDPYSSSEQFARLIEADPALAARLLRMANSVAYAQRTPVTTIQRAVTVLGLGQLRVVALGFELVSHLDRLGSCPFDLRAFWQQAVLRACLARQTAMHVVPAHAEEAFLVGLLQDCGVLALVQGLGREYAELYQQHRHSATAFYAAERKLFPYTHVDAITALGTLWQFPETIARPLAGHHHRVRIGKHAPDLARLCAVGYFVGSVGFDGHDAEPDEPLIRFAEENLQLDADAVDEVLSATRDAYIQVAHILQDNLPDDLDVTEMLVAANRHLHRHFADAQDRMRALEDERDKVLAEHVTLRNALGQYREQAARDPLTGLMNRRALLDAIETARTIAADDDASFTVMFLDVDNFKPINDDFGHQVGDEVLCCVAEQVRRVVGDDGLAGRYGGEEFVLALVGADQREAVSRAETLLRGLRSSRPEGVDLGRPITASVGAIWSRGVGSRTVASLIAAADELMYAAKRGGKDRCCFGVDDVGTASGPELATPSSPEPDPRPSHARRRRPGVVDA